MKLRAKLTVRNAQMIDARKAIPLSQIDLADAARINIMAVRCLESLDYTRADRDQEAAAIAGVLDLPVDVVLPPEASGNSFVMDRSIDTDMSPDRLLQASQQMRYLPNPSEDEMDIESLRESMKRCLRSLTYREKNIVELRYGLGKDGMRYTYEEIGRIFKVTRERVRQCEATALRKLGNATNSRILGGFADTCEPITKARKFEPMDDMPDPPRKKIVSVQKEVKS